MYPIFAQTDPTGIADMLQAAGPFALSAVLIVALIQLWKKLGQRDNELSAARDKFLGAMTEQTAALTSAVATMKDVKDGLERVEDAVKACPGIGD